jgi:cytochrome c peroxidase
MTQLKGPRRIIFFGCIVFCCFTLFSFIPWMVLSPSFDQAKEIVIGKGTTENLKQRYEHWAAEYSFSSPQGPAISLVWNKGLSTEFTEAKGIAEINLKEGFIHVKINGLNDPNISDVWLVDNLPGHGMSVLPETGDKIINAGRLEFKGEVALLNQKIDPMQLKDFEVDLVVVARRNGSPGKKGVLYGSTSLFQRIYYYPNTIIPPWEQVPSSENEFASFQPTSVYARGITPAKFPDAYLINKGRELFFKETFGGNGRTCGTCHPENNNLTIDPQFIATLPDNAPLFVAEFDPNLMNVNFEVPELMRKAALILENTNGFDDLNNFTMRGVPHTLGLRTTLSPPGAAAQDGTTVPPDERTGWSGDGSPVGMFDDGVTTLEAYGTLRDFAIGAIVQHLPKTISRIPGEDFRLPTEDELNALEAFQLSLGRQEEFDDLTTITLNNPIAERGRLNYIGIGLPPNSLNCNACHFNGGANTNPDFDFSPFGVTPTPVGEATNRSFAPRVEELIDQIRDIINDPSDPANPFDDGFGTGSNLFNVPSVVEAGDTGPFFHANQITTIEGMVSFYSSKRHLRDGTILDPIVPLNGAQVGNVGAFLRVINADENARSSIDLINKALYLKNRSYKRINLKLAISEIEDAIEVLKCGKLHYDDAVPQFNRAKKLLWLALLNPNRFLLSRVREKLEDIRNTMINRY